MKFLFIITFIALIVSFSFNKNKTYSALKKAQKKFFSILPRFLTMISLLAVFTTLVPVDKMQHILQNNNHFIQLLIALLLGSIIFVPGFIAFPLAAVLIQNGVSYFVVAAFTSSLMLVGFASLPVEIAYFGKKAALWRNAFSLLLSLLIALVVGIFYREF